MTLSLADAESEVIEAVKLSTSMKLEMWAIIALVIQYLSITDERRCNDGMERPVDRELW